MDNTTTPKPAAWVCRCCAENKPGACRCWNCKRGRNAARRPALVHLTHTGQLAGVPLCNEPRDDADRFMHPGYGLYAKDAKIREDLAAGLICPACAALWLTPEDEDTAHD